MLVDGWVDIHAHFFAPMPAEELQAIADGLRQNCWCIDHMDQWTPEAALDYMDRVGIQMQMLSSTIADPAKVSAANDYGAEVVRRYPDRFGLLAQLPTNDPDACLAEIARASDMLGCDGFASQHVFDEVVLSDPRLEPVWAELNRRKAVLFAHPNAYGSAWGRPSVLLEVAFQTAAAAAMVRMLLLGAEPWVPNPEGITPDEMREVFARLLVDTASTMPNGLTAALSMTTPEKIIYGSDCGVP